MLFEDGLRAYLEAQSTALGNRIWYREAPQGASLDEPHMRFQEVHDDPLHAHNGPANLIQRRWQFGVFSKKQHEVSSICQAIRTALDGYVGLMGTVNVRAMLYAGLVTMPKEEYTRLHQTILEFDVQYYES